MNKKAIIAMSGGVDSSVAAFLMKEKGFDCIGITMKLFHNENISISKEKSCCSLEDIADARNVANKLEIPYYVFNFTEDFNKRVIERFVKTYQDGATPNPCIDCNRYIKFQKLFSRALELDIDYVVTGHYARIEYDNASGRYLLKKAADKSKDQSYVLYAMTQEQLKHTLLPLGGLCKSEAREIAEKQGFLNAKKRDSQDICFVPDGKYSDFIEKYTGIIYPRGNFTDTRGNVLGEHKGLIRYTIGQRKGLGLSLKQPMYVHSKNTADNTVTLCEESELFSKSFYASDFNWVAYDKINEPIRVKAKVRYKQEEQWATASQASPDKVFIEFDQPQRAIAKGQAVVLYDKDIVVGGGIID